MGDNADYATWWTDLSAAHAELVLSGHDHTYQRFVPTGSGGAADPAGVTQLVVGTGGEELMTPPAPRSTLATGASAFGVLKLTLHANGWNGSFLSAAGGSFTDSFSGTCH